MAYISAYKSTIEGDTNVTSITAEMPTHASGDLLVVCIAKSTTAAWTGTPSGWTSVQDSAASSGSRGAVYAKIATSSSETCTFTNATAKEMLTVLVIKGYYGSTVAAAIPTSNVDGLDKTALPFGGGLITPATNNTLNFDYFFCDIGASAAGLGKWVVLEANDAGACNGSLSYTYQKTAAALTGPDHWANTETLVNGRNIMFSIRDDGNETKIDPYVDRATTPTTLITPFAEKSTASTKGLWQTALSSGFATVGGFTTVWANSTSTVDSGYNTSRDTQKIQSTKQATSIVGDQLTLTNTTSMTADTGVVFGLFRYTTPKDSNRIGTTSDAGVVLTIADTTTDGAANRAWTIGGKDSKTNDSAARNPYAIQVDDSSGTSLGTNGSPNFANGKYLVPLLAPRGAGTYVEFDGLWLLNKTVISGGTTAYPLDFLQLELAVNGGSGNIPLMRRDGSAATLWQPIQFGGADPLKIAIDLRTFQFPKQADGGLYNNFHVANDVIGVEFYGQASSDSLSFTNSVFTSDSSYYWRFNASHSGSAVLDFSGTSVIMANVTLQSTVTLDEVNFIDCGTFTQNGATLTDCKFDNTTVTSATTTTAALISDCDFISDGTGYGMTIAGTAGDFTLDGCTFTDFAATNGSTGNEAIYVNIATGTVNISITGDGDTPTIRTAGATVNVLNSVTATVTVIDTAGDPIENARVLLEETVSGDDIISGLTNASGVATASYAYTSDLAVSGTVRKGSSSPYYKPSVISGTITSSGFTATVVMVDDE